MKKALRACKAGRAGCSYQGYWEGRKWRGKSKSGAMGTESDVEEVKLGMVAELVW